MVRIVGGEVIHDTPPQRYGPRLESSPRKPNYQVFPSTTDKFGILAKRISLFGFESELIWLLVLALMIYWSGYKWAVILGLLLWLYQRNSIVGVKSSKVSGMGNIRQ